MHEPPMNRAQKISAPHAAIATVISTRPAFHSIPAPEIAYVSTTAAWRTLPTLRNETSPAMTCVSVPAGRISTTSNWPVRTSSPVFSRLLANRSAKANPIPPAP